MTPQVEALEDDLQNIKENHRHQDRKDQRVDRVRQLLPSLTLQAALNFSALHLGGSVIIYLELLRGVYQFFMRLVMLQFPGEVVVFDLF